MLEAFIKIYAAVFGLCFGSFAGVIIYRLPRGISIISPPSHCPECSRRLALPDLIPVFSRLFRNGRCRHCKTRVSWRYTAVEIICAFLFAGNAFYTGASFTIIPLCLLAFILLCAAFIDYDTQEIPDSLVIFGSVCAAVWIICGIALPDLQAPHWRGALSGAIAGAAPLFIIDRLTLILIKKDGFGFGDVKLMAMSGLFLGWQLALAALFFAVIAGGTAGAAMLASKKLERGTYIAFGPFLSAGVIAALWFGEKFIGVLF